MLLGRIGGGSYGEVWLARNALGTPRAVKIVHRHHFDHDRPYEREFTGLQRYEPVSRSHPGLVDVLQVGRDDVAGYFYYVMELADDLGRDRHATCPAPDQPRGDAGAGLPTPAMPQGSSAVAYTPHTLKADLATRGPLPFDECVRVGLALASALDQLHRQGLVHRDIKPSNIVFVDEVPKLADVGLVAAMNEARSFVGTEGYIPPEGPGTPAADLYSLGIVLYEMATGKHPDEFPEPGPRLESDPDHARWLEFNAVIHRASQADARLRYRSAEAMYADLELLLEGRSVRARRARAQRWAVARKGVLALAVLGAAAVLVHLLLPPEPKPAVTNPPGLAPARVSVFVLPFRKEPRGYWFWAGDTLANRLTDALIDGLGVIEGVRVGPRKSGWVVEDEAVLRERVRRDFGAPPSVTGEVRTPTNEIEVTVALWDAGTEQPRWRERFLGTTADLLALERQVLGAVSRELGLKPAEPEEAAMAGVLERNVAAWSLLNQAATQQQQLTRGGLTAAAQLSYRALELDSNCVDARLQLIRAYRSFSGLRPPREVWPQMCDLARQALQVDDTSHSARYWLAWSTICHEYKWDAGVRQVEATLPPDDHLNRAILYRWLGRFDAARVEQAQMEALGMVSVMVCFHALKARLVERRYEEGIREARRWIRLLPESIVPWTCLGQLAMESGDYATAREAVQAVRRQDDSPEYLALDGRCWALIGRRDEALRVLVELEALSRTQYVNPYFVARLHAGLGDRGKALEALERAVEDRAEEIVNADWGGLRTDPAWDALREEPRFHALLKQVGLDVWPK